MHNIEEIHKEYAGIDTGEISSNEKKRMKKILQEFQPEDLLTEEDHRKYIEILNVFRSSLMKDVELLGKNFKSTLDSLLSVGEDGVYSYKYRFIYELIQNVDDCEFDSVNDCRLNIRFIWHEEPARIVFIYNERGFTPENVFSITGIAEASKNIKKDKVEIGEKGIGFKSVFGIADSVHIESGYFSFVMKKENLTVPIPRYEGYEYVDGTRLTLFMSHEDCETIYRSIAEQYVTESGLLSKNPILFLNKLTHLKMYNDAFRSLAFEVTRHKPTKLGNILYNKDVKVLIDMKYHGKDGRDKEEHRQVDCYQYRMPITYGRGECISRYSDDTMFSEKKHNLIAVIPKVSELKDFSFGTLYSFLPTQVKLSVPVLLHVPYKLDSSREYVDPQNENRWFKFTNAKLSELLCALYPHLAKNVKEHIVSYIPKQGKFFYLRTNEKVSCLQKDILNVDILKKEKIYYTYDGEYETINNIISFNNKDSVVDPIQVYRYLKLDKALFLQANPVNMSLYGVDIIKDVNNRLFDNALIDECITSQVFEMLERREGFDFDEAWNAKIKGICLSTKQIKDILMCAKANRGYKAYLKSIQGRQDLPIIQDYSKLNELSEVMKQMIVDLSDDSDIDTKLIHLLERMGYSLYLMNGIDEGYFFIAKNGIILSKAAPLQSFAELCHLYDRSSIAAPTLKLAEASVKLNKIDDSISNQDYLNKLRALRNSQVRAVGKDTYQKYIELINNSGINIERFFDELLQNADDCIYKDDVASFELVLNQHENGLYIAYNEVGFTKNDVRAITAIGESTKKKLLRGQENLIGEKGVGFKSVFCVASELEIHSNGFHFKLTDDKPIIPSKVKATEISSGTAMYFKLKKDISTTFTLENVLVRILCLRRIKKLKIYDMDVKIIDKDGKRIIQMNGEDYVLDVFTHTFTVDDEKALMERRKCSRNECDNQSITCYVPKESLIMERYLYNGLPTNILVKIPLIIDAPFELTTSREEIPITRWNQVVHKNVYEAIARFMLSQRESMGLDVFKYIGYKTTSQGCICEVFSAESLNSKKFVHRICKLELLPVLGDRGFISGDCGKAIIVPDVIQYLSQFEDIGDYFSGVIVDTGIKCKYIQLLEQLGCRRADDNEIHNCITHHLARISYDDEFRKHLYAYLASKDSTSWKNIIKELEIFPVRTTNGTEFIRYGKNIFTHDSEVSKDDYYILESKIMSYDICSRLLSDDDRFNTLTDDVIDAKYRSSIENLIMSNIGNNRKASCLLSEFKNNAFQFRKYRAGWMAMLNHIPMLMEDGEYRCLGKFLNSSKRPYFGMLLSSMIVSEKYRDLAIYLGCDDILSVSVSDFDLESLVIEDEDIEDIQELTYSTDILRFFALNGYISKRQIQEYCLEYYNQSISEVSITVDEDFPGRKVRRMRNLIESIKKSWETPNRYIRKQVTQKKPEFTLEKENYLKSMYESRIDEGYQFCQICHKKFPIRYLEGNEIEKDPEYAWNQMNISLCLHCGNDYRMLRNNRITMRRFHEEILQTKINDEYLLSVGFADKEIYFSATHLAEIQEILRIHGNTTQQD